MARLCCTLSFRAMFWRSHGGGAVSLRAVPFRVDTVPHHPAPFRVVSFRQHFARSRSIRHRSVKCHFGSVLCETSPFRVVPCCFVPRAFYAKPRRSAPFLLFRSAGVLCAESFRSVPGGSPGGPGDSLSITEIDTGRGRRTVGRLRSPRPTPPTPQSDPFHRAATAARRGCHRDTVTATR